MNTLWPAAHRAESGPRQSGLTVLLDGGVPTGQFTDVLESHGALIDYVKFGWCTALVTKDIRRKVEVARANGVGYFLGGTLFEKCLATNNLDEFHRLLGDLRCTTVEVSNGVIDLSNEAKSRHIARYSSDFEVFSEVGYKDTDRSQELHPARWVEFIRQDLEAGAARVITEARESGRSGICRPNGELRYGLIGEILASGVDPEQLVFEAPNKELQVYFIRRLGPNANLANIAFSDVVALETLRNGLRADTFYLFEGKG